VRNEQSQWQAPINYWIRASLNQTLGNAGQISLNDDHFQYRWILLSDALKIWNVCNSTSPLPIDKGNQAKHLPTKAVVTSTLTSNLL
jgi:hypothetical protein